MAVAVLLWFVEVVQDRRRHPGFDEGNVGAEWS